MLNYNSKERAESKQLKNIIQDFPQFPIEKVNKFQKSLIQ